MKLIPGLSWFASLREKQRSQRTSADPGDMGTAFGLDAIQSLFQEPAAETRALPAPGSLAAWERRLTRRSEL